MERDLFSWTAWDVVDGNTYQFDNPVTKVQIGDIPVGDDHFDYAIVDFDNGILQFVAHDPSESKEFKIGIVVLGELDKSNVTV